MHLLIAAAGSGRRMGADRNKLLLPLLGRPLIAWTVDAALTATEISWIGIVGQDIDRVEILDALGSVKKPLVWIQGGRPARNPCCGVWPDYQRGPAMC